MVMSLNFKPRNFSKEVVYRLCYASVLENRSSDEREADKLLATLVATSLKNNPGLGITGMLYYNKDSHGVTQVLEGPEDNVRALFNRIAADYRHVDCEVLSEGRVGKRLHPDFGMAVAKVASEEQTALRRAGRIIRPPRSVKSFDVVRLQYSSFLLAPEGAAQAREMPRATLPAFACTHMHACACMLFACVRTPVHAYMHVFACMYMLLRPGRY